MITYYTTYPSGIRTCNDHRTRIHTIVKSWHIRIDITNNTTHIMGFIACSSDLSDITAR